MTDISRYFPGDLREGLSAQLHRLQFENNKDYQAYSDRRIIRSRNRTHALTRMLSKRLEDLADFSFATVARNVAHGRSRPDPLRSSSPRAITFCGVLRRIPPATPWRNYVSNPAGTKEERPPSNTPVSLTPSPRRSRREGERRCHGR